MGINSIIVWARISPAVFGATLRGSEGALIAVMPRLMAKSKLKPPLLERSIIHLQGVFSKALLLITGNISRIK